MNNQKVAEKLESVEVALVELTYSWFEQDGSMFLSTTAFDKFEKVVSNVLHKIRKNTRKDNRPFKYSKPAQQRQLSADGILTVCELNGRRCCGD